MTRQTLAELHAENLAAFTKNLTQHRCWHILPAGQSDISKAIGLFDTQTGHFYPPTAIAALSQFLAQHPFVYVQTVGKTQVLATLHSATRLLWNNQSSDNTYTVSESQQILQTGRWASLAGWTLPTKDQLYAFATARSNPYQKGNAYRLATASGNETYSWLTTGGHCDTDGGCWGLEPSASARIFACHLLWQKTTNAELLIELAVRGWALRSASNNAVFAPPPADLRWQNLALEDLLATWAKEGLCLRAAGQDETLLSPNQFFLTQHLTDLDYTPCRLPKLDRAQLTDPEKGLWELWGTDAADLKKMEVMARDPGRDVQRRAVAIDFGTSSTVVAMDTASGARELLRIGARDFYEPIKPAQFENPTVLECLDFQAFARAWCSHAYRPPLDWNWMRATHEAQASLRDNTGDTNILASILPRLKQWALRETEHRRVRLTDRQGHEIELPPHTERNPVRGQALVANSTDPFDPVELFAWYLGMAINWRGRGLFLKYYLSFPVKYPREVKERILASFRRGLQRSLPHTLIEHHPQVLNDFEVNDLASEPAAYAAAALPYLKVEPSDEGVPYAVFDFGGGTTDFDFGLLRWATHDEEDQGGYEQVFEHLASGGDNFLGGENLLEHLVYETFKRNVDVLRKERIQFTQPLDALPFAGSEAFLAPTQAAQTNTIMLAAKLRPFLEGDGANLASQLDFDLIDANGQKKTCVLTLDTKALDTLLAERIRGGAEAFLSQLARLRLELPANATIHLLLAGNGSRSRHVKALFNKDGPLWEVLLNQIFGEAPPNIEVHAPLPMDEANPHAPTTKTGVALGLLSLVPGENTLLVNHLQSRHQGQAPFAWFVGRLRRKSFEPTLSPGATYNEWHEIGPLQQGVFNLFITTSPRAHTGLPEGHPELKKHRLDFPAAPANACLFARAVGPHKLELAAAADIAGLGDCVATSLLLG
ncbi:MAG: hypothetical protein PHX60_03360 [Giesbergeria sp.]|uniref:hypothetical protein n=1 Tax=Giesbergeria sp. TaxID=2818473 RepID=UPI00261A9367|nr:hypothetical protein [Giesbergeria sp.]MDD2608719.1 hypothetical protein [Giesbergeria sp.]